MMVSLDQTPDMPQPFGYKVLWFAVKAPDPALVIATLELGESAPANWSSGLAAAYEDALGGDACLFVSPPVGGWVLAVCSSLPYPSPVTHQDIGKKFNDLFSRLMKRFDDVQFFGSHRVSDFAAWARALNGKPARVFAYADGEVLTNIGNQTPEEEVLGLPDLAGLTPSKAGEKIFSIAEEQDAAEEVLVAGGLSRDEAHAKIHENGRHAFPNEDDVVELAGLWSVDPTRLSQQDHSPGLGLVVRLPGNMSQ